MKTCKGCGVLKPQTEFYRHETNRDGLSGKCRRCKGAMGSLYVRRLEIRERRTYLAKMRCRP